MIGLQKFIHEGKSTPESGLVFDKDENGKQIIVAGTLEKLVSRLADQGLQGHIFSRYFIFFIKIH